MELNEKKGSLSNNYSSKTQRQEHCAGGEEGKAVNWKVFKRDTEAGRLLSRLYGVKGDKDCSINYPKLNVRRSNDKLLGERSPWNQAHILKNAELKRSRNKGVAVPKFGRCKKKETDFKVVSIPRRKSHASCQQTLDQNSMLNRNYRPPVNFNKQNSSEEKVRLSKLYEYGGGCALPDELTSPIQPIPLNDKDAVKNKDTVRKNDGATGGRHDQEESLADDIVREIKERQQFQLEVEQMGCGVSSRNRIVEEITSRMKKLHEIDASRLKDL